MAKLEIERKFLVKDVDWMLDVYKKESYAQGYFSPDAAVRIRVDTANGTAKIGIKGKGTLTRAEFEYPVPFDDGVALLLIAEHQVLKTRHFTKVDGMVWEVDVFDYPKGLVLAEIELEDEGQLFKLPSWVGKEVTHDTRYTNLSLAVNGIPDVEDNG